MRRQCTRFVNKFTGRYTLCVVVGLFFLYVCLCARTSLSLVRLSSRSKNERKRREWARNVAFNKICMFGRALAVGEIPYDSALNHSFGWCCRCRRCRRRCCRSLRRLFPFKCFFGMQTRVRTPRNPLARASDNSSLVHSDDRHQFGLFRNFSHTNVIQCDRIHLAVRQ